MFTALSPVSTSGDVYTSAVMYLTFEGMLLNHGNSFLNRIFVAPENGAYKFSFSTHVYTNYIYELVSIVIEKNGIEQLTFSTNGHHYGSLGYSWIMLLEINDQLKLKLTTGRLNNANVDSSSTRQMIWSGLILNNCPVTFSAFKNSFDTTSSGPLAFNKLLINEGNAFSLNTFKAPLDGVFEFSFAITQDSGEAQIDVTKNGDVILSFSSDDKQYTSFRASWLIELKKHDQIQLTVARGTIISDSDMTRIFNGRLLQHELVGAVMFCVYANDGGQISKNSYITFDKTLLPNIGGGYDVGTGKFRAPVKGSYEFSFTINSYSSYCSVVVERNGVKELGFFSRHITHSSTGSTWIMQLGQYDTIRLRVSANYGPCYTDSQNNGIFSGKLLKPE